MPWSLVIPTSPMLSSKNVPSTFISSPSMNGSQPPQSPSLSSPKSPLPFPSTSVTAPQSPSSSSSSLNSPFSFCVPRQQLSDPMAPSLVKRKRPTMIDIPMSSSLKLGFVAETPRGEEEVQVKGEGYAVYCKRGRRGKMEDRYSAVVDHTRDYKQAFFGVFDGHGGSKAADFAAENLEKKVFSEVSKECWQAVGDAIKEAYLTTDNDCLEEDIGGGTCCVTAMIRNDDLVVSNAGDCRAVMSRNGVAEALTSDHKPSRQDERDRIEALGGYVDCCRGGVWRIQGSLAVSRAIGDKHLKQWVIAEPETKVLKIRPACEFLILASDGLWDKVTDQEAIDLVRPFCIGVDKPEPFSACKKLAELSSWRGSFDDISVMIIQLGYFIPGLV